MKSIIGKCKNFIGDIYDDYTDQVYISQRNEMILNQLWPLFFIIVKIYFLFALIFILVKNVTESSQFNSLTTSYYAYFLCLIPIAIIIFQLCILEKLSEKTKIIVIQGIFLLVELFIQLYLYELLQESIELEKQLIYSLMFTLLFVTMSIVASQISRLLILFKFFIYLGIRENGQLFQYVLLYHIIILLILIIYYWDQQMIKLSKVKHFSEQSLKSVPSAVCILNSDCKKVLFSNRFMRKLIDKSNMTKTVITKSIKQDFIFQTQQSIVTTSKEIQDFFSHLMASTDDVKLFLDSSKANLELQDDTLIDLNSILQLIVKQDRKTQGNISFVRCQYIEEEQTQNELEKIEIEVRIKSLLQYQENKHAILLNLYDITNHLKSAYYKNLNQFKSKVIRSISHELRTRLNAIQGMIQMIQNYETQFDPQIRKYLKATYCNCRIQNFIIGSIIDYNLWRERKLVVKPEKAKLSFLIEEAINLFRDEADLKQIKIKYENKWEGNTFEKLDQEKFQSILIHIISNSIKFSKENGQIIIRVMREVSQQTPLNNNSYRDKGTSIQKPSRLNIIPNSLSSQWNKLSLSEAFHDQSNNKKQKTHSKYVIPSQFSSNNNFNTNQYVIEIEDNGIGMSKDKLESVQQLLICEEKQFEKFSQDASSGIMLGLRASNSLIKLLSGYEEPQSFITINSIQDQGTCVQIHLKIIPMTSDGGTSELVIQKESTIENEGIIKSVQNFFHKQHNMGTPQLSAKTVCLCENTIMIVDDEPYNLIVLESLLHKLNHQVIKASNGRQCIQILEKMIDRFIEHKCKGYKGVIMDYQMPIMNGEDAALLIGKICRERNIPQIPIYGLTGFSGEEEISRLLEAGMKEVYVKPITLRTLEELLSSLGRSEYQSLQHFSNLSQQFQCVEIDYNEDDKLVQLNSAQ